MAILGETLSLFVRFWLTIIPPLPESVQAAAKAKGSGRFEGFLLTLGGRLATGERFPREISPEMAAEAASPGHAAAVPPKPEI